MSTVHSVVVIYNPLSTGSAHQDALDFCAKVRASGIPAKAVPTKRAGHAKTLAKHYAERATPTMIVSASGDGGYNEVINGVLKSKNPTAIVGVLPSGNANDHYNFMHRGNTVRRITRNDYEQIDVLKIHFGSSYRYAHSYIGLGMTPQIGEQLTSERPSRLKEKWIVLRNLTKIRAVKITVNGHTQRYDHLVFSNIARMSKILRVADHGTMHDGEFEIVGTRSGSLLTLIAHLFHAASFGAKAHDHAESFAFTVERDAKAQLDGEVIVLKKGTAVTITSERKLLRTIV